MTRKITAPVVTVGLAALLCAPAATPRAQEPDLPALPLKLSAFVVNMSNIRHPQGTTAMMDITIKRWSTAAEREKLITTAVEKGSDGLLRELQRMPDHGRISIPAWRGPDPHNARLGWKLHYAVAAKGEDGGLHIGIATDRYIGIWEARENPRTIDYPFALIELRLDGSGKGTGKMAVATKIDFDRKKQQMVLENYSSEPLRLNEVKLQK